MLSVNPQILKDFNLFVNGVGNLGRSNEVTLPTVKFETVEVDNGGIAGKLDVPVNLDKLEAEFSFSDVDPIKAVLVGLAHQVGTLFTFRGSVKDGAAEIPVVAVLGGSIVEVPMELKKGEQVKTTYKMSVNHYELNVAGVQTYFIDKLLNTVVIGGTDYNAVTKANIGI